MVGYIFEEDLSFKILGLSFSSELDWDYYIVSIAKAASKKIGTFILWSFFPPKLLSVSVTSPYGLAWNTVAMSGRVSVVAAWIFYISYINGYVGLLVEHLVPPLNPWIILEMLPV